MTRPNQGLSLRRGKSLGTRLQSFFAGHSHSARGYYIHISYTFVTSLAFCLLRRLGAPFLSACIFISTLGSSAITCIPSFVASNIQPLYIAVSRVRPLLFLRHRCPTGSFSDLHAIALQINLPVSLSNVQSPSQQF